MGTYDEKSSNWMNPPKRRRSPMDSGNNRNDKSCCYGAAAINSIKRGKYRLAYRYTGLMVRRLAGVN